MRTLPLSTSAHHTVECHRIGVVQPSSHIIIRLQLGIVITVPGSLDTMKVCLLGLVAILLLQCCAGHTHKNQAHHGHHHGGHVHQQSPLSSGPSEALNEQSFYIQQLFRRYGQLDRLDFNGFQNLLLSLGLGQVRLLGLEHESLGHDHVAHLDMLEVQEGHHTHGPHVSTPGQEHSEPVQDRTSVQHSLCQPAAAGVTAHPTESPEDQDLKGGRQHEHKVEWDEPEQAAHSHRHAGDQQEAGVAESSSETPDSRSSRPRKPSRNKGSRSKARGHGSQEHDHDHKRISDQNHDHAHNRSHDQKHLRDPEHISDQNHDHAHDRSPDRKHLPDPEHISDQNHDPDQIRDRDRSHDSGQDSNPLQDRDHGHGKQHVRKRAAAERSGQASHNEDVLHQHEECLNLTQLLLYYGLNPEALISPTQFSYLCPALLYQIDSRVCIKHYHQVAVQPSAQEPNHTVWPWLWGFISITIISLLSLLGVLLVPIINQSCFKFLLTFLVALAVGTLSGDALLHLLPHSQEEHDHSVPSPAEQDIDMATLFDGVWKGLTALAGIYMLFIIEHCIGIFKHYRDQQESWCTSQRKAEEAEIGRKLSDHQMKRQSDVELMQLKVPPAAGSDSSALSPGLPQSDPKTPSPHGESSPVSESVRKPKVWGHSHHGHSHHGHCHSDQEMKEAGIASIAWMVIMGDGMHNFSDGLAIGAAFSANVTGGISTSVAVFCHELPHELGDFAVLLKAGMSVKQAVVYNVLSALMAYVGMVIGTAVGQYTHNVTSWIFAVTAGMFLYVALVDMLPEMLHGDSEDHKRCQMGHFLLQNLGMLSGFAIMLLIAIFEDRIVLDFGL